MSVMPLMDLPSRLHVYFTENKVNYAKPVVGFIIVMFYKTCEQSFYTPCGWPINGFGHSIHNCIGKQI